MKSLIFLLLFVTGCCGSAQYHYCGTNPYTPEEEEIFASNGFVRSSFETISDDSVRRVYVDMNIYECECESLVISISQWDNKHKRFLIQVVKNGLYVDEDAMRADNLDDAMTLVHWYLNTRN